VFEELVALTGIEQWTTRNESFSTEAQFKALLEKLPENLHPFTKFLYATGMRPGRAAKLSWDMVNEDKTALIVPGELIKNRTDFTLPLVYTDEKTIKGSNSATGTAGLAIRCLIPRTSFAMASGV
jgi:Phage integrase family